MTFALLSSVKFLQDDFCIMINVYDAVTRELLSQLLPGGGETLAVSAPRRKELYNR